MLTNKVIKVFEENAGKERAEVIALMQSEIKNIGPAKVNKHCSDTHFVFDMAALNRHQAVTKLLQPPSDPAFHIEIQKNSLYI